MKNVLLGLATIAALVAFASLAHTYPVPAFITWVGLPLLAWSLGSSPVEGLLSRKGKKAASIALIAFAVLLSLFFFANVESYRDSFGEKHIAGYTVTYSTEYDEFGRPWRESQVHADSRVARFLLWGGELLLFALAVGVPLLTWKSAERSLLLSERSAS